MDQDKDNDKAKGSFVSALSMSSSSLYPNFSRRLAASTVRKHQDKDEDAHADKDRWLAASIAVRLQRSG